jgi:hypothetical protein
LLAAVRFLVKPKLRTAVCQSLQPICLQFLILPSSGKSKIEDYPQKVKFELILCAGRLASEICGIIFKHNSHRQATRATEPASKSISVGCFFKVFHVNFLPIK